ncbi:MAG: thiamine pyrophosphate-dependent enzyme, partial [Planctomycetaceae bacterium]
MNPRPRMSLADAVRALHDARTDEVVLTAMGAAREWLLLGPHPLDFVHVPSSMGQTPSLGLGIALAQPRRKVIVCNGDGAMLMNLGALVTITALAPPNLVLLIFDNGVYEVTGAQSTPGSARSRGDGRNIDYAALAETCGFTSVFRFEDLSTWRAGVRTVLDAVGPTFVHLAVAPTPDAVGPKSPGPGPH